MLYITLLLTCILRVSHSISPRIYFENDLPAEAETIPKEENISLGITKLALNMNRMFSSMNPYENILFSPLSIASVLALLLLGAKGYTAMELAEILGINHKARMNLDYRLKLLHDQFGLIISNLVHKENNGYEIDLATGVFPQNTYQLNQNYVKQAGNVYKSDVWALDYAFRNYEAMAIINKWVSNKTHDRIKQLLAEPPIPETTVIIASALYFSGNWKYPFLQAATRRAPFYVRDKTATTKEEIVDVDLMVGSADIPYLDDEKHNCQMIGLPYIGEDIYMYVILPNDNIGTFMKNFSENDLHSMIRSAEKTTVIYALPKMTLDNNVDLTNTLKHLGLSITFNPSEADLKNMADGAFVNQILHKVELEMDEIGTKASAATFASTLKSGATPVVRVDRPFFMFIYHKTTDTVLFWGKIMKPTPNFPSEVKKIKSRRYH